MPTPRLGIDFGTSHTVAVLDRDGAAVPLLFDSSPLLPSAVYADPGAGLVVGADAVNSARLEPARYEPNPKRRVDDGQVLLGDREFEVEELFAAVLSRVRRDCERVLGAAVPEVTLTYPAAWGSARRLVLTDAAESAGFHQVRLVPEPVAAAGYFTRVLRHDVPAGSGVVVADLGGGTFDASVVAAGGSGFEVLSVDGIENLGGVDVDHALLGMLTERFGDDPDWRRLLDPRTTDDRRLLRGLYEDVRSAKERLSRQVRADLPVPLVGGDTHFTREELEDVTRPLLRRAVRVTKAVIRASQLPDDRLAGVFLVGGASRMPLVANMLHRELGRPPIVLEQPELAVAQGAALPEPGPATADSLATAPQPTAPADPPTAARPNGPVPPAPGGAAAQPPTIDRPPTAVRTARALMWLSGATGLLWLCCYLYAVNYRSDPFAGDDVGRYSWLLIVLPAGIALSAVIAGLAAVTGTRRDPLLRILATVANGVIAVLAVIASIFAAYVSNFVRHDIDTVLEIELPLLPTVVTMARTAAVIDTGLALATIVLLWTPIGLRWFSVRPSAPPPAAPSPTPVRLARVLMWFGAVLGAVAALGVALDTAHRFVRDDAGQRGDFGLLALYPAVAVAACVLLVFAVQRVKSRSPRARRSAITACLTAGFGFLLVTLTPRDVNPGEELTLFVVTSLVAVVSVAGAVVLSTRSARTAFAATV